MSEICCKRCDSSNCEGCNIMILSDMLNKGQLNVFMNENHTIDPDKIGNMCNDGFSILGATLLSIEDIENLPYYLREHNRWWWLKSHGYLYLSDVAAYVSNYGAVNYYGGNVSDSNGAVRPALYLINLKSSNLHVRDKFEFGGKEFEIISDNLAFCTDDIGCCAFRKDRTAENANVYEESDIKKFIDDWFNSTSEDCKRKP